MNRNAKLRNILKKLGGLLIVLIVAWIIGDFVYSRVIQSRMAQWESTIERNYDGTQQGHEAFEVGTGDTAILMVHGINESPSAFQRMAPVLAAKGFHCRVIRLPGFAKPMPEYSRSKSSQWVAHVHAQIQVLLESHEHVFVLAHSLGGATAIQVQLEQQPAIDGLILLAPAIEVSNERSPLLPARAWHNIASCILLFTTVVENPFTIDAKNTNESMRSDRNRFSPISVVDETFRLLDANRGRANEIKVPTLMVLTKHDRVIDYKACQQFFQQLGSEQKKLSFNNRAGHALPYDYGWESVAERAAKFVGEVAK